MTPWKERISIGLPRTMVVAHDLCMVWLAWIGLHEFRYAMLSASPGVALWSTEIALVLLAQGLVFWRVGLYRGIWRFASVPDLFNILKASVFGLVAIRRQGIYFAMITLALAQMLYFFYLQTPFTHGEDGIQAVPRGRLFGFIDLSNITVMYYTVFTVFIAGFLLIWRVIHSPFGQVLKAIRENEARAISLGYDTTHYKFMAFVLSATLAGLAGATKALVFQLASLTDVHWTMSGEVVLMTLLGGLGTIFGPVVGALVIITMENYLAQLGAWVTIVQGIIFVVCVLTFRRGVVGEIAHFIKKPL